MADLVRIYLDEDVSVLIGVMLRARGLNVLTTLDAGNLGASDIEQLNFAIESDRILLTHNRVDFERLAVEFFENDMEHAGLIIAVRKLPGEITRRTLKAVSAISSREMRNQIKYI